MKYIGGIYIFNKVYWVSINKKDGQIVSNNSFDALSQRWSTSAVSLFNAPAKIGIVNIYVEKGQWAGVCIFSLKLVAVVFMVCRAGL